MVVVAGRLHRSDLGQRLPPSVFLSDALSILQAFQNNKLPHLIEALQQVAHDRRMVLQWILAHCRVPGNELADRLAKPGKNNVLQTCPYFSALRAENLIWPEGETLETKLRLLPGPGENDSFHLKNGTDCVGANAKKKKEEVAL